ncbi:hypothetical protein ACFQGX_25370 [Nonomuraea dietziae]|uniref:hypothetical protein n=1 Tax=Nonomuraea dietziae TaxID=65515 RepID=UPI003613ECAD
MRTLIRNVRVFDGVLTVPRTEVLIEDDRLAAYDGVAPTSRSTAPERLCCPA